MQCRRLANEKEKSISRTTVYNCYYMSDLIKFAKSFIVGQLFGAAPARAE
jgi:hypothetical protein